MVYLFGYGARDARYVEFYEVFFRPALSLVGSGGAMPPSGGIAMPAPERDMRTPPSGVDRKAVIPVMLRLQRFPSVWPGLPPDRTIDS